MLHSTSQSCTASNEGLSDVLNTYLTLRLGQLLVETAPGWGESPIVQIPLPQLTDLRFKLQTSILHWVGAFLSESWVGTSGPIAVKVTRYFLPH